MYHYVFFILFFMRAFQFNQDLWQKWNSNLEFQPPFSKNYRPSINLIVKSVVWSIYIVYYEMINIFIIYLMIKFVTGLAALVYQIFFFFC